MYLIAVLMSAFHPLRTLDLPVGHCAAAALAHNFAMGRLRRSKLEIEAYADVVDAGVLGPEQCTVA